MYYYASTLLFVLCPEGVQPQQTSTVPHAQIRSPAWPGMPWMLALLFSTFADFSNSYFLITVALCQLPGFGQRYPCWGVGEAANFFFFGKQADIIHSIT